MFSRTDPDEKLHQEYFPGFELVKIRWDTPIRTDPLVDFYRTNNERR